MKKNYRNFLAGLAAGTMLWSGGTALAAGLTVTPLSQTGQRVEVDGQPADVQGYNIDGYTYFKLADLAEYLDFGLTWDNASQTVGIYSDPDSIPDSPPQQGAVTIPQSEDRLILKEGNKVLCDDGSLYEITDMSRFDNSAFSAGPLPGLPTPAGDWSAFPTPEVPKVEVWRFGEKLFIRNLYETRRMQYTVYNALLQKPTVWRNGEPLASVSLSIPAELEDYTGAFWPWRDSELQDLVHSRPNSRFYIEAWDCYSNGVFQYTRYCVVSL